MGHSQFFSILLLSSFLLLFLSLGFGVEVMEIGGDEEAYVSTSIKEKNGGKFRRMMIEVMDYAEPGPNTNPRTGYLTSPPPPPA